MAPTAMTEAAEAPAAGLAGLVGPVSGRQAERLQAQLVAAEVKRRDREAEEKRRQARLDAEDERRERRQQARDERHDKRRDARDERLAALGQHLAERSTKLMIAPLMLVPGWLGWDAMSEFGTELYGFPGHALPVLSEVGMWLFDIAIVQARRKNPGAVVWPLYAGMAVFAGICASLNFMHGLLGPIPGSIAPGVEAGLVYAPISISGIIAHQIVEFGGRKKAAGMLTATAEVAPQDENVAPENEGATNTPVAGHLTGPMGRRLLPVVALVGPAGGRATKADLDRAVAARKRAERENAELRQQLADALRGNPEKGDSDHEGDDETPARRGEVQDIMRAYWEKEIAAGRIPNGADLNRAAGKQPKYSLGKKRASEWRTELPAEFTDQVTGNQQEKTMRDESTSLVPAELAK